MVTPTEDFEYMGKRGYMIYPRVFFSSPEEIIESDRRRYREDFLEIHLSDGECSIGCLSGYENAFDLTKNTVFRLKYANRFYD